MLVAEILPAENARLKPICHVETPRIRMEALVRPPVQAAAMRVTGPMCTKTENA